MALMGTSHSTKSTSHVPSLLYFLYDMACTIEHRHRAIGMGNLPCHLPMSQPNDIECAKCSRVRHNCHQLPFHHVPPRYAAAGAKTRDITPSPRASTQERWLWRGMATHVLPPRDGTQIRLSHIHQAERRLEYLDAVHIIPLSLGMATNGRSK